MNSIHLKDREELVSLVKDGLASDIRAVQEQVSTKSEVFYKIWFNCRLQNGN